MSAYVFAMRKSLDPTCPVVATLDLIGERWTIMICAICS